MASVITKELALKIMKKLGGRVAEAKGSAHDLVEIWHEGVLIASFGIRHGSSKDAGHDHIPSEIFVNSYFAKLLGQCPKSRADWIHELTEKGYITNTDIDIPAE